jgi:hypothetical protein
MRENKYIRILTITVVLMFSPLAKADDSSRVQKAIEFLKTACVTSGSSLELKASGDGSLKVRSILGSGVQGSITLTKKELEGFADAASELSAKQASEMRNCMKPYIDKILSSLLTGTASIEPKIISIETSGNYFVTAEFDRVIATVSTKPDRGWYVSHVAEKAKMHPAKVKSYFIVADKNKLGRFNSVGGFQLLDKGLNYVLAKRLVN